MQNKITCLIFDFDGVIADTDLGRYKALKKILLNYDSDLANSISKKDIIGLSTKGFLTQNSKKLGINQIDEIVRERHKLFFSNLSTYCLPYKDMKETIVYLSSKFDLAIVTTNTTENVNIALEHLEILPLFKWIIGREKSENEYFIKTYEKVPSIIDKRVEECIVIEDSNIGINAATREGYFCIRFDPENIFEKGDANLKVSSYKELKEIIMKNTHGNTQ